MSLHQVLNNAPAHSIDEAIAIMTALDEMLPPAGTLQLAACGLA
jgi:hypothetical protein